MAESEEWASSFVMGAIAFLSEYFDVRAPKIVMNCEETCPAGRTCTYLACYMPWTNTANFKSGSEKGIIVAHEFGHRLVRAGVIENGEAAAIEMEEWWAETVNELVCSICGAPMFVSDDVTIGSEVECSDCGSIYETVPIHGKKQSAQGMPEDIIISKGAFLATAVGVPIAATFIGSITMDRFPKPGIAREENAERAREFLGFMMADMALAGLAYVLVT